MRTREERRALHMHKPNAKAVSHQRSKMNSDGVKYEAGSAYQEINVDGQTFYAALEVNKNDLNKPKREVTRPDKYMYDEGYDQQ